MVSTAAAAFAAQFTELAQRPFDAWRIPLRMPARLFDEKRSVVAAQFHFRRLRLGKMSVKSSRSTMDGRLKSNWLTNFRSRSWR
jgi:hypothetical protein